MSNIIKKRLFFSVIIILLVLLGIATYTNVSPKEDNLKNKDINVFDGDISNLSTWVVYWDLSSNEEIEKLNNKLKTVSYFAVNFDSDNKLVMPEQLINYYNETKSYNYDKYITIVNDKANIDGSYAQKDANLLKSLLSNPDSRDKHIEEIINLALKYGFDGIEIDYEKIRNDMKLWDNFIEFINRLYQKSGNVGLKLRVVLETNTPFDKLNFAEGPAYVLMCYNLHGGSSKPGGKASSEFIKKSIESMSKVLGKKNFAIATGGFDWASNGKTTSITEAYAVDLLKKYNSKAERDSESQCLFFNYKDENDMKHEVWYADKITLKSWMQVITEKGYDISIWRLGGNLFE